MAEVRIVKSGQVYKQKFDAEVSLVKSLRNASESRLQNDRSSLYSEWRTRDTEFIEKQRKWFSSPANDDTTENPVFFREVLTLEQRHKDKEDVATCNAHDVQDLPDVVRPAKVGSDILDRVSEARRKRHDDAVEDMHFELQNVSTTLEPQIVVASENLQAILKEHNERIRELVETFQDDGKLKDLSWEESQELWAQIDNLTDSKLNAIDDFDREVEKIEEQRAEQIKSIMGRYGETLSKIAYLLPGDLDRFMDSESQTLNFTLIANRRTQTDIYSRLRLNEVVTKRDTYMLFGDRIELWKQMHVDRLMHDFRAFMERHTTFTPPNLTDLLDDMKNQLSTANSDRMMLIEYADNFVPPTSTKMNAFKWNEDITRSTRVIDELHSEFMHRLFREYESVYQVFVTEMHRIRNEMIDAKMCTTDEAQRIIETRCYPLLGNKHKISEDSLMAMERSFERMNKRLVKQFRFIFTYLDLVAGLWENHERTLLRRERDLQEKLELLRQEYEREQQEQESALDTLLDKLRQDSSDSLLRDDLVKANDLLNRIKNSYQVYHDKQVSLLHNYPNRVRYQLIDYDSEVCKFFSVLRAPSAAGQQQRDGHDDGVRHAVPSFLLTSEEMTSPDGGAEGETTYYEAASMYTDDDMTITTVTLDTNKKSTPSKKTVLTDRSPKKGRSSVPAPPSTSRKGPSVAGSVRSKMSSREMKAASPAKKIDLEKCETLVTSRGTLFYILPSTDQFTLAAATTAKELTIATMGESGKADTGSESVAANHKTVQIFDLNNTDEYDAPTMEAMQQVAATELAEANSFVMKAVNVPPTELAHLRKTLRLAYLEHVEEHCRVKLDQADAMVRAKIEEAQAELGLFLHLQQPRGRRIELDIHHVRAAELLLHAERVSRHCKAVISSLNDLRGEFDSMSNKHESMLEQYKLSVNNMEDGFSGASKTSKLQQLSNEIAVKQKAFMHEIRTDLRKFREKMDRTGQVLRESNANFITSFKVFSDGGNFSTDEIEEYRKQLDRTAQRIDQTEIGILADLEGMETKRMQQSTKIQQDFEEKFKHSLFDLTFVEKMAKWLTNVQIRIKVEVAQCNTEARQLARAIEKFEIDLEACEHPTADKRVLQPEDLFAEAKEVIKMTNDRAETLHCLITVLAAEQAAIEQTIEVESKPSGSTSNAALSQKTLAFNTDAGGQKQLPKHLADDPALNTVKSLLRAQKVKPGMLLIANGESSGAGTTGGLIASEVGVTLRSRKGPGSFSIDAADGRKLESRAEVSTISESTSKRSEKTTHQASQNKWLNPRNIKTEKKFQIFGDLQALPEAPEATQAFFINRIRKICKEALGGLLTAAELFYKQKGYRPVTRQSDIPGTFDDCADQILEKLVSYFTQVEQYHNESMIEFRKELEQVERLMERVPAVMFGSLLKKSLFKLTDAVRNSSDEFKQNKEVATFDPQRKSLKALLRPELGHPNRNDELQQLHLREMERRVQFERAVELQFTFELPNLINKLSSEFYDALLRLNDQLLFAMDQILTVDEVATAKLEARKLSPAEVVVRKQAGLPLVDNGEANRLVVERGARKWANIVLPKNVVVNLAEIYDYIVKANIAQAQAMVEKAAMAANAKSNSVLSTDKSEGGSKRAGSGRSSASTGRSDKQQTATGAQSSNAQSHSTASERSDKPATSGTTSKGGKDSTGKNTSSSMSNSSKQTAKTLAALQTKLMQETVPKEPPAIPTEKTTLAHFRTITERDLCSENYNDRLQQLLVGVEEHKRRVMYEETHWQKNWQTTFQAVQDVFNVQ